MFEQLETRLGEAQALDHIGSSESDLLTDRVTWSLHLRARARYPIHFETATPLTE
jgi:hypothetical protein